MRSKMTRREILAKSAPAVAIATTIGASTGRADTGNRRDATAGTADAFRVLVAAWLDASDRRTVAECRSLASPDDTRLQEAFSSADGKLLTLERHILDLTVRTVGTAPASIQVDDFVVMVANHAGDDHERLVAISAPSRRLVL